MTVLRSAMLWVGVLAVMAGSAPARAALIVQIGSAADRDARFWVETRSHYGLIHGGYAKDLDARFMRPGETAEIPVWLLNPVTFTFVSTSMYHPAYIYQSKMVDSLPSVFRSVVVPVFEPRSWRDFIDSGEKVRHAGEGIHLANVIDHFKLFIDGYLPARDRAGTGEGLQQYVPLFEALLRHTELTLPYTTYGAKVIDDRRATDREYAQRLDQTEQAHLRELRDLLSEIKALLARSPEERMRLRVQQAKLVNADSVYHELMTADDRQRIAVFLDTQFKNTGTNAWPEKTYQWIGRGTTILYSISLGDRYSLKDREGGGRHDCYRTGLSVDLYSGQKTGLSNTQRDVSANFCRNEEANWVLRLPGT